MLYNVIIRIIVPYSILIQPIFRVNCRTISMLFLSFKHFPMKLYAIYKLIID